MKNSDVCITRRSPLASLLFKGLAIEHATVKWIIVHLSTSSRRGRPKVSAGIQYLLPSPPSWIWLKTWASGWWCLIFLFEKMWQNHILTCALCDCLRKDTKKILRTWQIISIIHKLSTTTVDFMDSFAKEGELDKI